jgi:AraC-like DNA-binding protein
MQLGFSVPFAFWLLAQTHFDDDFRLRPLHLGLLAGLLSMCWLAWQAAQVAPAYAAFWAAIPRLVGMGFVIHALAQVYLGARSDLLLHRLRLRFAVLSLAGTYILLELLAEVLLRDAATTGLGDRVHAVSILALVLVITGLALRVRPDVLRPSPPAVEPMVTVDPGLVERLMALVEQQHVYREEGLTITGLADRLGAQEHKVRQLINAHLGFRNFNAFLHHYRLRAAQQSLLDPGKAHLGVAQIAFEAGYRSLGPFNKAFKEATGVTPTEFRTTGRRADASTAVDIPPREGAEPAS